MFIKITQIETPTLNDVLICDYYRCLKKISIYTMRRNNYENVKSEYSFGMWKLKSIKNA